MPKVGISPGHGGFDPGAIGPAGTKEKDIALAVSRKLRDLLFFGGYDWAMTRETDVALARGTAEDLRLRANLLNREKVDVVVSIHCNSFNATAHGMEIWTLPGKGQADILAERIVEAWAKEFPGQTIRKDLADGDSDKEARFQVLRQTDAPAVLIEMGFISNPAEEKLMASAEWQQKAAHAICAGIEAYLPKPSRRESKTKADGPQRVTVEAAVVEYAGQSFEALLIGDKTFVALKPYTEAMGRRVDKWDNVTRTAVVVDPG